VWALLVYLTWQRLPLNRRNSQAPLYEHFGPANRVTLLRAWLIAVVAGFVFQPWPDGAVMAWMPGMLYFAAAMLDRVDGLVARRSGQSSILGEALDTIADALGLAVASLLAVGYGQTHWSFLLFGAAYYLFHMGLLWRKSRGLPIHPLPPAIHRRVWAGFQMGYLVVALWPLFHPPLTWLGGFAFMLPALIGFLVDWLIVSGRINRQADAVNRCFTRLTGFSLTILQPGLRLVVVMTLALSLWQSGLPALPASATWRNTILLTGFALTSLMLLLGVAGRYFSLLLIGLLAWYYMSNPLLPVDYVLFCAVVWLLMLGTGRFSLWQQDAHWLYGYDGA
jgi:CDP-diacylglycerol--glycerol-3-phosphate 3-phosphatidyltransferase